MPRWPDKEEAYIDEAAQVKIAVPARKAVRCKAFHMVVGVDLIGSKTSMSESRSLSLEVTPIGIKAVSKTTNRHILIPWTNIKGAELYPEEL